MIPAALRAEHLFGRSVVGLASRRPRRPRHRVQRAVTRGAPKAGIGALTQIVAEELGPYGVTANAVAPGALTRRTEDLTPERQGRSSFESRWVAPLVTWLASRQ